MKLFVEMCSAKASWRSLSQEARQAYLDRVDRLMRDLENNGVEIVAWGRNDKDTPERASYDFFAVFKFPDANSAMEYEQSFRRAGWYDYFDQVNVVGTVKNYRSVLEELIGL